jgi:hypothetical protein
LSAGATRGNGAFIPEKYVCTEAARMYLDNAKHKYLLLKNNSRK